MRCFQDLSSALQGCGESECGESECKSECEDKCVKVSVWECTGVSGWVRENVSKNECECEIECKNECESEWMSVSVCG